MGPGLTPGPSPVDPICLLGWPRTWPGPWARGGRAKWPWLRGSGQPLRSPSCACFRVSQGGIPPPPRAASRWQMNQRTRGLSGARQQRAAGAQGTHPSRGTAWRCPRLAQDGARCQSPGTCGRGRPSSPSREVGRADPAQLPCSTRSCGSPARPVHPMAPLHVSPRGTPKICRNTGSGQLVGATLQVGGLRTEEDRDWPHPPIAWKPGCRPRRASGRGRPGGGEALLSPLLTGLSSCHSPGTLAPSGPGRHPEAGAGRQCGGLVAVP